MNFCELFTVDGKVATCCDWLERDFRARSDRFRSRFRDRTTLFILRVSRSRRKTLSDRLISRCSTTRKLRDSNWPADWPANVWTRPPKPSRPASPPMNSIESCMKLVYFLFWNFFRDSFDYSFILIVRCRKNNIVDRTMGLFQAAIERECYPSPLGYYGFPKSCCTSVNEVICHGIPDGRPLENGDLCNGPFILFIVSFSVFNFNMSQK